MPDLWRGSSKILVLARLIPVAVAYQVLPSTRLGGSVHTQLRAAAVQLPASAAHSSVAQLRMAQVDEESSSIYDDFMGLDDTGASVPLALEEKEKLYLECLDAYYNEDKKEILTQDKYEQLKLDLEFSEGRIMTYTKNEIRYLLANKRYKMGKPVLTDEE